MWDLARSGIEPLSPALEGRFFTPELPGKPTIEYNLAIKKNEIIRMMGMGMRGCEGENKLIGEGNGNPLQYSCLENPMDGGA